MARSRTRVSARRDKRIYSQTARRTKKININPGIMRGGIRL